MKQRRNSWRLPQSSTASSAKISGRAPSKRIPVQISSPPTLPPHTSHPAHRHHVPHRHRPQRAPRRYPGCPPSSTTVRRPKQPFHQHIPHLHPSSDTVGCSMLRLVIRSRSGRGDGQNLGSPEELRQGTHGSETRSSRGMRLTRMLQYRSRTHLSSAQHRTSQTILVWIAWIPLRWSWR